MPNSLHTDRHRAIVKAIAETRRNRGLTQAEVAKAMGGSWSQPIMVSLERGGRRIDLVELLKLSNIIGLDVHTLIDQLREIPDE